MLNVARCAAYPGVSDDVAGAGALAGSVGAASACCHPDRRSTVRPRPPGDASRGMAMDRVAGSELVPLVVVYEDLERATVDEDEHVVLARHLDRRLGLAARRETRTDDSDARARGRQLGASPPVVDAASCDARALGSAEHVGERQLEHVREPRQHRERRKAPAFSIEEEWPTEIPAAAATSASSVSRA